MSDATPRRFDFDTWFGDDGQVRTAPPVARPRRVYSATEVEALRAEAFAEGQADQKHRDEATTAQALAEISRACVEALGGLDRIVEAYRTGCADLAITTGKAVAFGAIERFPHAPLAAALEALTQEVGGAARLVIRSPLGSVSGAVEAAAAEAGFGGRVVVREDPGDQPAAFVIEWPDGRAEYDPVAAAERVRAALNAALSSEADGGIDLMNGDI